MAAELLSPAGDMEKLKTVLHYGADAVYLGGKAFNLRAASHNFSKEQLGEAVAYAHALQRKVYVTLNVIAHDREIRALPQFVRYLEQIGVDAVIVADMGVFDLVQEHADLPIHVSTQASTTNWRAVRMWQNLGAKRVVLARECSLTEIKKIKDKLPDMEIEVFVHGSMCMAYSGRCMISQYFTERDGNRGACANACRWKYSVMEEKRPGEYFPVYEDETGSYLYNSKDLCTIEFIDQILDTGVDGLKIEGRMKTIYYGATVTKVYREALDSYLSGHYEYNPRWLDELKAVSNRAYTSGFYLGKLDQNCQNFTGEYNRTHEMVGTVKEQLAENEYLLEIRGRAIEPYEEVELLAPAQAPVRFRLPELVDYKTGALLDKAHPSSLIRLRTPISMQPFDIIRHERRL